MMFEFVAVCRGERLHRPDGSHRSDRCHRWAETLVSSLSPVLCQRATHLCKPDWSICYTGVLTNGEPHVWKARRHWKDRGSGEKFVNRPISPFAWLDPLPFLHGGALAAVRYCSALLLMLGASIFSFSNAVQISSSVRLAPPCIANPSKPVPATQYDHAWLALAPYDTGARAQR